MTILTIAQVLITSLKVLCSICLLYTSDAADEEDSVDLGGRRIIKKKNPIFFQFLTIFSLQNLLILHSNFKEVIRTCAIVKIVI